MKAQPCLQHKYFTRSKEIAHRLCTSNTEEASQSYSTIQKTMNISATPHTWM